jgi:hypothetical protein
MKPQVPVKPEDRDEVRALAAHSMLRRSLANMQKQLNILDWRADGGPEAEAALYALETGGPHPLLEKWRELRRTVATNVPDPIDRDARRLVVLMVEALSGAGLSKRIARKQAARAVKRILPAAKGDQAEAIRHWQENHSLAPDDEKWIADALKRCGNDHRLIIDWFVKQIEVVVDPAAAYVTRRILTGR